MKSSNWYAQISSLPWYSRFLKCNNIQLGNSVCCETQLTTKMKEKTYPMAALFSLSSPDSSGRYRLLENKSGVTRSLEHERYSKSWVSFRAAGKETNSQILEPSFAGNDAKKRCEGPCKGAELDGVVKSKCAYPHNGIWVDWNAQQMQGVEHVTELLKAREYERDREWVQIPYRADHVRPSQSVHFKIRSHFRAKFALNGRQRLGLEIH